MKQFHNELDGAQVNRSRQFCRAPGEVSGAHVKMALRRHLENPRPTCAPGAQAPATSEDKKVTDDRSHNPNGVGMKPEPWKPSPLLAAVVAFGALGLVFAMNEPLGTKWFQKPQYSALLFAQLTSWVALRGLARVMDRSLDLVLDLVLLCRRRR